MGFDICFVAAKVAPEELAKAFEIEVVGKSAELPGNGWWVAQVTVTGWSILWSEDFGFGEANWMSFLLLAPASEVILCEISDGVGFSRVSGWGGRGFLWSVSHGTDTDDVHELEVVGSPPEPFEAIYEAAIAEQEKNGEDEGAAFSVPLDLAKALTGFSHDGYPRPGEMSEFFLLAAKT